MLHSLVYQCEFECIMQLRMMNKQSRRLTPRRKDMLVRYYHESVLSDRSQRYLSFPDKHLMYVFISDVFPRKQQYVNGLYHGISYSLDGSYYVEHYNGERHGNCLATFTNANDHQVTTQWIYRSGECIYNKASIITQTPVGLARNS